MPDQSNAVDIPVWAYLLAVSIPALIALAGVVWQGWLTRKRGTNEHEIARGKLNEIAAGLGDVKRDVSDLKADVRDLKSNDRDLDGRVDMLEGRRHRLSEGA